MLEKIIKDSELLKINNPNLFISIKGNIPENIQSEAKKIHNLCKRDKIYVLISKNFKIMKGRKEYFLISGKGVSIFPENNGSYYIWEEIEKSDFVIDENGASLNIYFKDKNKFAVYYNVGLFGVFCKRLWINTADLINKIAESFPTDKKNFLTELFDIHSKSPDSKKYRSLKKIYYKKFKKSYNYKIFLKKLKN